ncbi:MAG: sigma-54-dependent Fis family transcriptional regulator, partial [Deltaproteobacteria bacterium]|nr:sigma-54-dependent Fis family transcriptional regulator [Deltaproteobacteria bacterium]
GIVVANSPDAGTESIRIGKNRRAVVASPGGFHLNGDRGECFIEGEAGRRLLRHGDLVNIAGLRVSFFGGWIAENNLAAIELHGFLTSSAAVMKILHYLNLAAGSDEPVLITGESGSGKEILARAAHKLSRRAGGNFIAVNCGAIPEEIFESEFFGHEKGSFTGAGNSKRGIVETAHDGTIFLDEIGELSANSQKKLLRLIETGEFYRVGAIDRRIVPARFIAATNRDLTRAAEAASPEFRRDLLHRLCCHHITIPPLRERKEDIALIARRLVSGSGKNLSLGSGALKKLLDYDFEGNVRELKNVMKRAILLNCGGEITEKDIVFAAVNGMGGDCPREGFICEPSLREYTEAIIREKLREHNNSRRAAYTSLKIPKSTFYSYLKRMNIT